MAPPVVAIADFVSELDSLVPSAMSEWQVPGLAIAVVQGGAVALLKAYGCRDVEAGLPVTTDTHFMICSITKSFTSTGLAMLVDERKLDWKRPVRDYVPEFRLHDPVATDRITVRDLLCHHSGLPRHDWIHLPGDLSPPQMLAAMRYLEPSEDIRSTFQYQNLGYLVAGMVAERVLTMLPDRGVGVAVFTNSDSPVASILANHVFDRTCGREPVPWLDRFRERRRKALAQREVDRQAHNAVRRTDTRPSHQLADYVGDYEHPGYGRMSIAQAEGELQWAYRGMSAPLTHRHYDTFELPEAPGRLLPDRLAISFFTDREGNITSLSAPLEPLVKDIVFARVPAGDCMDLAFLKECVGTFSRPHMTIVVAQDNDGQLMLTAGSQPTYKLVPYLGSSFVIADLVGFRVEFRRGSDGAVSEVIFHQPNGTFVAPRAST